MLTQQEINKKYAEKVGELSKLSEEIKKLKSKFDKKLNAVEKVKYVTRFNKLTCEYIEKTKSLTKKADIVFIDKETIEKVVSQLEEK